MYSNLSAAKRRPFYPVGDELKYVGIVPIKEEETICLCLNNMIDSCIARSFFDQYS